MLRQRLGGAKRPLSKISLFRVAPEPRNSDQRLTASKVRTETPLGFSLPWQSSDQRLTASKVRTATKKTIYQRLSSSDQRLTASKVRTEKGQSLISSGSAL